MLGATSVISAVSPVHVAARVAETYQTLQIVGNALNLDGNQVGKLFEAMSSGLRDMTSPLNTGALDGMPIMAASAASMDTVTPGNGFTANTRSNELS